MKYFLLIVGAMLIVDAGEFDHVKITEDISYIYVYHKGKAVKVHRIQDTNHKLTGKYAKIYKPTKYLQPIKVSSGVKTIAEVELLRFMEDYVNKKSGLLIDVRSRDMYSQGAIPSSVNIPSNIKDNSSKLEKILKILGVNKSKDNSYDFSKSMKIAFYCHGLWSEKSSDVIKVFLDLGYPEDKILYYRGGFQMWKILGLTTVANN